MFQLDIILEIVKDIVSVSLFFVWVVRYNNIIEEFKLYNLPEWLRDVVGIVKLTSALLIQSPNHSLMLVGNATLIILMISALIVHLRIKNSLINMAPAILMLSINLFLFIYS